MKKILLLMIIPIIVFAACRPTPESELVVQKRQDEMIEAAKRIKEAPADTEGSESITITELIMPEVYSESIQEGKLSVKVEADVIIPESEALPIVRVEGADFSQEQVTALFDYFCGGTQMHTVADEMTKDVIETQILNLKALIAKEESKENADSDDLELYERQLKAAQEALPSAPDEYEDVISDGTLKTVIEQHPKTKIEVGRYTALSAISDTKSFRVTNNSDREEIISYVHEDGSGGGGKSLRTRASLTYKTRTRDMTFGMGGKYLVGESGEIREKAVSNIGVTPEEARQTVETVLEELSLPMAVKRMYLIDDGYDDGNGYKEGDNFAYQVECSRVINNATCAIIYGSATGGTSSGDSFAPNPSWFYESLIFLVNGDGIIKMEWVSPTNILETVAENCTLLSFEDIEDVFEKMMPVLYEYEANQAEEETVISINRAELELVRISEQNSIKYGLLVPAWRFYGTRGQDLQMADECFLTINAIDGSIINTDIGY